MVIYKQIKIQEIQMQAVFFLLANMTIMFFLGYSDRGMIEIGESAAVYPLAILFIGILMGILSGSIIQLTQKPVFWFVLHTASTFLLLSVGLQAVAPLFITIGTTVVFGLCSTLIALLVKDRTPTEQQVPVV